MNEDTRTKNVTGVIVGRFQIDDLHEGHYDLLKEVYDTYENMLIVVGLSPSKCIVNNPLDFDTRRRMLMSAFPTAKIGYVEDCYSDKVWSTRLDTVIASKLGSSTHAVLHGGRDSFIPHYFGKFETKALIPRSYISASEIRNQLAMRSKPTADFRAGAIWAMLNQWPAAIPTIDVAVIDQSTRSILLGKRNTEDKFRLIGGFCQPGETYETAAIRELQEETHLKTSKVYPVKSFFIDDWRYKSEQNKITTFLYIVSEFKGTPKPDDDIDELAWFALDKELFANVVPNHVEMIEYIVSKYIEEE